MLAKIIENELGNREGWSFFLTKKTILLHYLIHLLSLLTLAKKGSKECGHMTVQDQD